MVARAASSVCVVSLAMERKCRESSEDLFGRSSRHPPTQSLAQSLTQAITQPARRITEDMNATSFMRQTLPQCFREHPREHSLPAPLSFGRARDSESLLRCVHR